MVQDPAMDYRHLTVEEALRMVAEKAGMLRFVNEQLANAGSLPDSPVFNGLSDVCSEIEELAGLAKSAVGVQALSTELLQKRKRVR